MADNGGQWRTMADNGGQWRTMADNGGQWRRFLLLTVENKSVRLSGILSASHRASILREHCF